MAVKIDSYKYDNNLQLVVRALNRISSNVFFRMRPSNITIPKSLRSIVYRYTIY